MSPQAEILPSKAIKDTNAALVADFSSRGLNATVSEIMKPNISAPGVEILTAFSLIAAPSQVPEDKRSVIYSILSGTSMACHPSWATFFISLRMTMSVCYATLDITLQQLE
ncbi:putative cucumisin [Lupinus albus]|uniref:Putative cucumisin n=1 Tax=Lupinus albus TaxID=3870 RepID=A0A6A4QMN0_LUPAL|nr:putative cucumisin [Lupinus albus]